MILGVGRRDVGLSETQGLSEVYLVIKGDSRMGYMQLCCSMETLRAWSMREYVVERSLSMKVEVRAARLSRMAFH